MHVTSEMITWHWVTNQEACPRGRLLSLSQHSLGVYSLLPTGRAPYDLSCHAGMSIGVLLQVLFKQGYCYGIMSKASLPFLGDKFSPQIPYSSCSYNLSDPFSTMLSGFSSPKFPIPPSSCEVAPNAHGPHTFITAMSPLLGYNFAN